MTRRRPEPLGAQQFAFTAADGSPFPVAPATADLPPSPLRPLLFDDSEPSGPIAGHWDGEPLDLDWVVSGFAGNWALRRRRALDRARRTDALVA